MFLARSSAYSWLTDVQWTYEDFPPELGQIEGTTQHFIEKVLGYAPAIKKQNHLVYVQEIDGFTNDTRFSNH